MRPGRRPYKAAICLTLTPKSVLASREASIQSTAICVLGEKGKIVTEARVASAPESLVAFMRELPHGIAAVGLEAGPLPGTDRASRVATASLFHACRRHYPGGADR